MSLLSFHLCFWVIFVCASNNNNLFTYKANASLLLPPMNCSSNIFVDSSGHGDHNAIQEAIDSVPQNNDIWVCIHVKSGNYREQVKIPADKPYIYLKGEARKRTSVIWDGHHDIDNATLVCDADNILIKSITFINSYNFPPEKNRKKRDWAVAAKFSGDKIAVYRCGFKGWQDTIWDNRGRHYFKKCTIIGAVDFIFGNGQSMYEKCIISVDTGIDKTMVGYITSQGRDSPSEKSGFVFKKCYVNGNGKAYLGRPWGDYSRVIFFKTHMENIIVPQGWWANDELLSNGGGDKLTYVEEECSGPGSDKSMRMNGLSAKLSTQDLHYLTSISYIDDNDGWLHKLPPTKLFA